MSGQSPSKREIGRASLLSTDNPSSQEITKIVPAVNLLALSLDLEMFEDDPLEEDPFNEKLVVMLVGLPARGKSFLSQKLRRYLCWGGHNTKVFNVGNKRRQVVPEATQDASFFASDAQKAALRDKVALESLDELLKWLKFEQGSIGIHDATNTTRSRRQLLVERIKTFDPNLRILFIELICNDEVLLERNIQLKVHSPDYRNKERDEAIADFRRRLLYYEQRYETLEDRYEGQHSYLKMINVGKQFVTNKINGYLASKIVSFLMNYHVEKRSIWIVRHGHHDDLDVVIGGDSPLSEKGKEFAAALAQFITMNEDLVGTVDIWTSSLKRAQQTARIIRDRRPRKHEVRYIPRLNEIFAGAYDGMPLTDFDRDHPEESRQRINDKLGFRYPGGGESYIDVIERVNPLIVELERRKKDVFIVAHRSVARPILAYFLDIPKHTLPHIIVPLHALICLTPTPSGCIKVTYQIDLDAYLRGEDNFWTRKESELTFRRDDISPDSARASESYRSRSSGHIY